MIVRGGKELSARYYGRKVVGAVYYGARLVWEAIASCFGSGAWMNERKWSDEEGWK